MTSPMTKGKATLPDLSHQTQKSFFGEYFRGKSAMASQLTNIGNCQDDSLKMKIGIASLRSDLKRAYSIYTSSLAELLRLTNGACIKILVITVALIDVDFG